MSFGPDDSLGIGDLLSGYAAGRWTLGEVMDSVADRIEQYPDKAVFIDLLPRAEIDAQIYRLEENGKSPGNSPLFGVPFAVKDNIDVAGRPTTAACPAFAYHPQQSATVVRKLCEAGAIVVGKTNLDQFATGLVGVRSPYGACVNPFDSRYICGGSSSGSAAAVARGLVSFSLGTDTAGSGRVPAAFNNIVGLKPSRGLLSTAGVVPACKSLDCVSVFALTCGDASRVAQEATGYDAADPYSRLPKDFARPPQHAASFRFGVPPSEQLRFFGNREFETLYGAAIERMKALGGNNVVVDCTPFFEAGKLLYGGPWIAERYGGLKGFLGDHSTDVLPVIREIMDGGKRLDAVACFEGFHQLAELVQRARAVWERVDLLLVPTAGTIYQLAEIAKEPIELNKNLGLYTTFANLMDLCAVAVPAGFGKDGLPAGVSLIAPAGHDGFLVEIGEALHRRAAVPLGATGRQMTAESAPVTENSMTNQVLLAVVGAHLSGQPLNGQLTSRGATLVRACRTSPEYRLFALAGTKPAKPGLVKVADGGAAIEVEVWALTTEAFGSFVAEVPPPMVIGNARLADGSLVKGFLCEPYALTGSTDITSHGGWRDYLASR